MKYKKGRNMKRQCIKLIIGLVFIVLLCLGCTHEEMGYVIRDDITFDDLGFLLNGTEKRLDVTETDMLDAMGWPYKRNLTISGEEYSYYFEDERCGEGTIIFIFSDNGFFKGIDLKTERETPSPDELVEKKNINPDQYKKPKLKNIKEKDLSFIDNSTTVSDIQKTLGAPHDLMNRDAVETITTAYVYHLTNGNMLLVAYEHGGVIVKAWVVDKQGNVQDVLVDRTDIYGTVEDE